MKKILISYCLLIISINILGQVELTKQEKDRYILHVKQYCNLLKDFAKSIDNITLIDSIFAICENDKVQTFDDLTTTHKKTDIEFNSIPLFQYLQNITTKYNNNLEVSFSNFNCEKTISEPTAPIGEFPLNTSYALVHVDKRIKGKGIDVTIPLKITINTSNLKVSGTISEKYEDPHSIYLRAIELIQTENYTSARNLLEKCANYRSYSGRYRALTQIGLSYYLEKNYIKAIERLSKASEHDPVGGIFLATVLIQPSTPIELRNSAKALSLLEKYAENRDKDFPIAYPLANMNLGILYQQGEVVPVNRNKAEEHLRKAKSDNSIDNNFNAVIDLMNLSFIIDEKDPQQIQQFLIKLTKLETQLAFITNSEIKKEFGLFIFSSKSRIYIELKQFEKAIEAATCLTLYDPKESNYIKGKIYTETRFYDEAIKHYQKAADLGETESCLIMFYFYFPFNNSDHNYNQLDDFSKYLMSNTDRDMEKAISYLKIAAASGHSECILNLAKIYLSSDYGKHNFPEGIKWSLIGSDTNNYYTYSKNAQQWFNLLNMIYSTIIHDKHYELVEILESYSEKSMSANRVLSAIYNSKDYPKNDSLKANKFLEKGIELDDPTCIVLLAYNYLTQKDTMRCEQLCLKLIERKDPDALCFLGNIETGRKHYDKALSYYQQAYDMKHIGGAYGLCELYIDGLGVPRMIDKAIEYANKGIEFAKTIGREDQIEEGQKLLEKCNASFDNEELTLSNLSYVTATGLNELNKIANSNLSADKRIELSEETLNNIFASPTAIVKTIGSNNSTIVSTETAEDFLLRLSTSANIIKITIINCITDDKGKVTELRIKETTSNN